ncbi:MAG: glycosyltransferase family 4 protein [Omnitrophica bacterium]|nr:glycosyltransferase family 4 protein [Candidatus Omnitrophota bacterium]
MKVLFVISGTKRVAASRYRVYQYLPHLEEKGIRTSVFSSTSDFMTKLAIRSPELSEAKRFLYYIALFIERFLRFWPIFFMAPKFDLIFLQRVTFPFGLGRILRFRNKKIIFDIDDAIFLPDTVKYNTITRWKGAVKEREVRDILKSSRTVIVENEYIKDYVSRFCKKTYKIRGPIDTERYFIKETDPGRKKGEVVLGWIGSPATTSYLKMLNPVFSKLLACFSNIKIMLIGAGNYSFPDKRVVKKEWQYETEVDLLQGFDVGLMPMPDDNWTRGKLGCKMLQYMAVGIPSVASFTSTNEELIRNGENGFLVKSESEWISVLSNLIENKEFRNKIGHAGRRTVEDVCSVAKNTPRLLKIFESLKD